MAKFDEFNDKLSKFTTTIQNVSDTAGTIAGTAGNVIGSFQQGKANANGRPINDIEVTAEVGEGVKFIAFALIASLVLFVFLGKRKK